MTTLGAVLLIAAAVTAIIAFFTKRDADKDGQWWSTCKEVDCKSALSSAPGAPVAVAGEVRAPDGQVEPLGNQPAAWFSYTVTESWEERERRNTSEGEDWHWVRRSTQREQRTSTAPFAIADSTGAVSVTPRGRQVALGKLAQHDSRTQAVASDPSSSIEFGPITLSERNRRNHEIDYRVEYLPPGVHALIGGEVAQQNGEVVLAPAAGRNIEVCFGSVADQISTTGKRESCDRSFGRRAQAAVTRMGRVKVVPPAVVLRR